MEKDGAFTRGNIRMLEESKSDGNSYVLIS